MQSSVKSGIFEGIDMPIIIYYLVLVAISCLCVTSATISEAEGSMFSFSNVYIKHYMWVGVSLIFALAVMLLDASLFHKWAYIIYGAGILLLIATLLFGTEINGARAWLVLGPVRIQSGEVVKIAASLAMARMMSEYNFSISRPSDLFRVFLLLFVPLLIILMQNDTGTGIVLCSLLFVLYREGLNKWLCIPILTVAALFIFSFLLSPTVLLILMVAVCIFSEVMMNGEVRSRVKLFAAIILCSILIYFLAGALLPGVLTYHSSLLIVCICVALFSAVYALMMRMLNILPILMLFVSSLAFLGTTDYVYEVVLQEHQQKRISTFLGLETDSRYTYNTDQSKIAIGSGGLFGKGYMNGTQIQHDYVPEKHTDFIFCTIGEEWGFMGCMVVLALYLSLILRLMKMGERIGENFGRIYCYSVAAIILFHLMVNVGMTIGVMPVMGIPLPFMSYGGTSFVVFTMLLFVAIRLDSATRNFSSLGI